jgi:hemerythrin superfamily protein
MGMAAMDVLDRLKDDHRDVEDLFRQFEAATEPSRQKSIAIEICGALTRHAELEEQLFYPRVREAIEEPEMVDEAVVEHDTLKYLIEQIESGDLDDDMFRASIAVLKTYVEHHVEEEEREMFKRVRESDLDLDGLAEEMDDFEEPLDD